MKKKQQDLREQSVTDAHFCGHGGLGPRSPQRKLEPLEQSPGHQSEEGADFQGDAKLGLESQQTGWVAQKYIEKPLLVAGGRKMDIRQWVLVTHWNPLMVWNFHQNYARISEDIYDLYNTGNIYGQLTGVDIARTHLSTEEGYHATEMLDLTQGFDTNSTDPPARHVSSDVLKQYIGDMSGDREVWNNRIMPAIEKGVLAPLLCSRSTVVPRSASCEMFGYDFALDSNLNTWLIEVNAAPAMSHSSPVTARMVPAMVESTLKVMVDLPAAMKQCQDTGGTWTIQDTREFDTGVFIAVVCRIYNFYGAHSKTVKKAPESYGKASL
ncbi:hypothetical protein CYMTET_14985 [Cymbomonas tetramitiformis]|uniref:Uncharacterized protein n=1 Tax=Cymbomonas tetramitiformis TaxID=36881 RepID=A0AAE0L9S8_9CHLO|nr:hypothetical protein CYMTET_14985 [Cymbomonas tetramitiformis]